MTHDLRDETKDALDVATKAVKGLAPKYCSNEVQVALNALVDCCAQLARVSGVPNAIEPETGRASVKVETE
jgi:hypothetical protein